MQDQDHGDIMCGKYLTRRHTDAMMPPDQENVVVTAVCS